LPAVLLTAGVFCVSDGSTVFPGVSGSEISESTEDARMLFSPFAPVAGVELFAFKSASAEAVEDAFTVLLQEPTTFPFDLPVLEALQEAAVAATQADAQDDTSGVDISLVPLVLATETDQSG
jgi:hypothetical protein